MDTLLLNITNTITPIFGLSIRIVYDTTIVAFSDYAAYLFGAETIDFSESENGIIYLSNTLTQGSEPIIGTGPIGYIIFEGISLGQR